MNSKMPFLFPVFHILIPSGNLLLDSLPPRGTHITSPHVRNIYTSAALEFNLSCYITLIKSKFSTSLIWYI